MKQKQMQQKPSNWAKAFGDEYDVPFAVCEAGLIDRSCSNDVCPSFSWPEDQDGKLTLWCEHPDKDQRSFVDAIGERDATAKQFIVTLVPKHEDRSTCTDDTVINTDSLEKALAAMRENRWQVTPRFVWVIGAIREQFPDIPEHVGIDNGGIFLWDRQEKKSVVIVAAAYGNLICLEVTPPAGSDRSQPFTNLETWLNAIDNDAMESEGIVVTDPAKMKALCQGKPKFFRVNSDTVVPGGAKYQDWYHANTPEEALELAREDAHRYGLPDDTKFTVVEVDPETLIPKN